MKRLIITGDSHTVALGKGLHELIQAGETPLVPVSALKLYSSPLSLTPFFAFDGDTVTFDNGPMKDSLEQLVGRREIDRDVKDSVFALVMGFTTTKLVRRRDWRGFASWRAPAKPGRMHLSDAVIEAVALDHLQHVLGFYDALRSLGLSVLAVEAPPVRADELAISAGTDPDVVLEVDRLTRRSVERWMGERGVPVVASPVEACDAAGFLRPEFANVRQDDFHHANAAYGRIMLKRVVAEATRAFGPFEGTDTTGNG